jgi:hypothetical protein
MEYHKMTKQIINCETGEVIERDLNAEEIAQQIADEANILAIEAELVIKAQPQATAKADLLAKLGITADEARLLLS